MTPHDFVKTYLPFAKESEVNTGISAIATLAQSALESAWGEKTSGTFNFFGIKADASWKGDKKLVRTREVIKGKSVYQNLYFRSYKSAVEGFTDHANFFLKNPRYAEALKVKGDYNKFIDAIAKAGYATAIGYGETLKAVAKTIVANLPK